MGMTDREIYEGLKRSDRTVLRHVYRQYFRGVDRYVREHGGGGEDALDVFQDSVVALYLQVQKGTFQLREDGRLGTYLFAIGKNVWRAKWRKRGKLPVVALEPDIAVLEVEADDALIGRVEGLQSAFDSLGHRCRRLLRLYYYEKLSLRQIAELMTITERTAKNTKYRCMQTLRSKLKPTDD
jgi:RNA polymerase sigma factor (sigma-70 family)